MLANPTLGWGSITKKKLGGNYINYPDLHTKSCSQPPTSCRWGRFKLQKKSISARNSMKCPNLIRKSCLSLPAHGGGGQLPNFFC